MQTNLKLNYKIFQSWRNLQLMIYVQWSRDHFLFYENKYSGVWANINELSIIFVLHLYAFEHAPVAHKVVKRFY